MTDSKRAEVISVRDAALAIVRRIGKQQTTGGKTPIRVTMAEIDGVSIMHNTPFTPLPAPTDDMRRVLGTAGKLPLPYSLDIWDAKKKAFSVQWSESELRVTSFKRGEWVDRLKATSLPNSHIMETV